MNLIWRPYFPDSSNGAPIATDVSHLLPLKFDYENVSPMYGVAFFEKPINVAMLLAFYLVSKTPIKRLKVALKFDATSPTFSNFIAIHNLGLAIFSAIVAWNSWAVVLKHLLDYGFWAVYCDTDSNLWKNGLGAWSTIFYLSKFYEFVDTWILVLKGKSASFLQVYHHTGIVLAMWGGVLSQSSWLLFVVLLNSVIHTFMYTYFFIKTLRPQQEIKAARYLTMAQIGQFFTGILASLGVLILGEKCASASSRAALAFLQIYGFGLIALFAHFATKKYSTKRRND